MFTKQHYEAIARAIRLSMVCDAHLSVDRLVQELADIFQQDNPLFDRQRWMDAATEEEDENRA